MSRARHILTIFFSGQYKWRAANARASFPIKNWSRKSARLLPITRARQVRVDMRVLPEANTRTRTWLWPHSSAGTTWRTSPSTTSEGRPSRERRDCLGWTDKGEVKSNFFLTSGGLFYSRRWWRPCCWSPPSRGRPVANVTWSGQGLGTRCHTSSWTLIGCHKMYTAPLAKREGNEIQLDHWTCTWTKSCSSWTKGPQIFVSILVVSIPADQGHIP